MARWAPLRASTVIVGAVGLAAVDGEPQRVFCVEFSPIDTNGRAAENPLSPEQIAAVVEAVLPVVGRRALLATGSEPTDESNWLTNREQGILRHLLEGRSVREIADLVSRSPHTVHDHVKSLHRKIGARSRGQLIARALGHIGDTESPPVPRRRKPTG